MERKEFGETRVLVEKWSPTAKSLEGMATQFIDLVRSLGFTNLLEEGWVPGQQAGYAAVIPYAISQQQGAHYWHQDGVEYPAYLIVWSNMRPTLVRNRFTGHRFKIPPRSVALIDNDEVEHSAPAITSPRVSKQRVFMRVRVAK